MTKQKFYLNPPSKCDLCKQPITTGFSDARLPAHGCWANVCPSCAAAQFVRYGTGLGQRYEASPDGRFCKVEG
jgi:hypothetical protein